jgi:cytochrome c peroxidase
MFEKVARAVVAPVVFAGLVLGACGAPSPQEFEPEMLKLPGDPKNYAPLATYEAMKVPADNPITVEKASLGWQLWFDKRLSGDGTRSCYGCHVNEKGLTDGLPKNTSAVDGKPLARHTPTLWNIGYQDEWYWDGRAKTLEGQALAAWKLANMGAKDPKEDKIRADVLARINAAPGYTKQFAKVFGGPADEKNVSQALATFMRTIISQTTPFDRWKGGQGDANAISAQAKRGWEIFQRIKCTNCHVGALLLNKQFHNVGIGVKDGKPTDVGRFTVTKIEKDTGAFKTPTLRDVARSAPYFHDGSVATLEEAVKIMTGGGIDNPYLDRVNLQKADVSADDIRDIVEFLKSLTETALIKEPKLP